MSDLMYNEVPVIGSEYNKGDWQAIAVHDDMQIKGFFGDYRWMSNFFDCPVYYEGILYRNSENAYQAAKLLPHWRSFLKDVSAYQSKNKWKTFGEDSLYDNSAEEWDYRKYDVMSVIVFDKFFRNQMLKDKLLTTGTKYLEETNWWSDVYWGVDTKKGGKNNLGIILMNIRDFWKNKPSS